MWTDENVAKLKRLWDDGYSAALIGAELGCSRNAVLGKIFRLQLETRVGGPRLAKRPERQSGVRVRRKTDHSRMLERLASQRYREKRKGSSSTTYIRNFKGSRTSADFRAHLPVMPEMSKSALREMLRAAVINTATP